MNTPGTTRGRRFRPLQGIVAHSIVRCAVRAAHPAALVAALLAAPAALHAQAATGAITGRVLDATTGEYLANAEVRVAGTNVATTSEAGGYYRLSGVPAGTATLSVTFTGLEPANATVTVSAGQTSSHDFNLQPAGTSSIVKLEAFTVSSEKEGDAKAIMAQRNSMNITNSVSSDVFGTTSEGNVGEFLKYLPGVDLEYVEADTRTPRLGALDPSYTGVTMNGMGIASADAFQQVNGTDNVHAGGGNRSFGFEQVSINSIESIEISQTVSADQDANAPAGTINLKTKKAFDRKERYVGFSVDAMMNSEDPSLKKTYGPGDTKTYKIKPGGTFDYYDSFLNHRLGVVFNVSESNMYNQQRLIQMGYDTKTTPTDPRPYVLNNFTFKSGPKFTERFSVYSGLDFRATHDLTLSVTGGYQWYDAAFFNRQVGFSTSRAKVTGDGLTNFDVIDDGATMSYGGAQATKLTRSYQLVPSFEYKHGNFRLNGAINYSTSTNSYEALAKRDNSRDVPVNTLTGLDLHLSRSSLSNPDWTIAQIAGTTAASTSAAKDMSNYANFVNPRVVDDGRFNAKTIYQGLLDATYSANGRLPTVIKAGLKVTETSNANDDFTPIDTWAYVGPGGGPTGSWAGFPSPTTFDMGVPNVRFVNLAGQEFAPTFANRNAIANLFYAHPEYFVNNATAANWYAAEVGNHRRIREQINAGYLMATTRWNKLMLRAGVRAEQTIVSSLEFNPLAAGAVTAAGYAVDKTGRATTVPGLIYQYTTQPKVERTGKYTNLFPSASAKYVFTPNLQFQVGYSHTIRRPNYNDIGGIIVIDENALSINIPNAGLKPEISDNIAARLSYYFEPVGNLSLSAFQNRIKDAVSTSAVDAEETDFGLEYPGYTVYSHSNNGAAAVVKGLTLDYRQNLGFLPGELSRIRVFANASRNVVDPAKKWGVPPWMASGGVTVPYRRLNVGLKAKWTDNTPWNFTEGRFRKHRVMFDLDLGYRFSKRFNLFVQGRNITNEPDYIYNYNNPAYIYRLEHYGTIWTFGVSGRF